MEIKLLVVFYGVVIVCNAQAPAPMPGPGPKPPRPVGPITEPKGPPSTQVKKATYVVIMPSLLRPGRSLNISVQILKTVSDVTLNAKLHYNDLQGMQQLVTEASKIISKQGIISLEVPTSAARKEYNVTITGSGGLSFRNQTTITTDYKSLSVFIQTDKATYKPGKLVRFRAMAVYSNLMPYKGKFNITIEDPNKSKIRQWLDVTGPSGVFAGELQLSEQPVLGAWKINVKSTLNEGKEKVISFTVAEYVLPKFEVKVDIPQFLLATSVSLPIRITAKYTYGKNVKGRCMISVNIKTYSDYERRNNEYKTINRTIELIDGVAETTLARDVLVQMAGKRQCYSSMCYAPDECVASYAMINEKLMRKTIIVHAEVTEDLTGNMIAANDTVRFEEFPLKMKFLESTPNTFKPGLNWTGTLQVTRIDDSPPMAVDFMDYRGEVRTLVVTYSCRQTYSYSSEITRQNYTIPQNNMVTITFKPNINYTRCSISVKYKYASTYKSIQKFLSMEQQGIQISVPSLTSAVKVNTDVHFHVTTTEDITGFYYQLLSKGLIIKQDHISMGSMKKDYDFVISFSSMLCRKAAPSARILVWYISQKGEIIVDSLDFNVEGAMGNDVSLTFSSSEVKPGDNVSLTVQAHPSSYVALLAVDKSVLLMGGTNDITEDKVMNELRSYDSSKSRYGSGYCCRYWWPIYSGGKDTSEVLKNAGVITLTDGVIFKEYIAPKIYFRSAGAPGAPGPQGERGAMGQAGARGPAGPSAQADDGINQQDIATVESSQGEPLKEPERVRTEFPETWIWTDETTGADGKSKLTSKVPDTITSWVASAFALSDKVGLGVSTEVAEINVLKPFFISLNLPYSVIRGEEIALQITVFNYLKMDTQVVVTLEASDEFMVRHQNEPTATSLGQTVQRTVMVKAGDGVLVSIWIVPVKLGQIPLSVKARSTAAADAVERKLLVEPEGEEHEYSRNVFINHVSGSKTYKESITVEYPTNGLVVDSIRALFTVIGDIMGPSINGLDRLLRMPYGCGEQNMVKFAPNIYIMHYLKATNQLTPSIQSKALNYLDTGYQRELTYRRSDSSFSAFGNADKAGSMWLTAFVIRCFHQAKPYIQIDQSIIDSAAQWIVNNQNKTGDFQEPKHGRVIHSGLQGGSSKGMGLTAYVLATLLEIEKDIIDMNTKRMVDSAIQAATIKIEGQLSDIKNDPYALSLVAYVLTLGNSPYASTAKGYLDALATKEGDKMYWTKHKDTTQNPYPVPYWRRYYQAPSYDIEMTAYALLTYAKLGLATDGMYIAAWLASQRNSLGGYRSTQDTVIALQSLSWFESTLGSKDNEDMSVSVTVDGATHNFQTITKQNIIILQSHEVSGKLNNVQVTASGTGIALFQMSIFYHQTSVENAAGIELTVTSHTTHHGHVIVDACGRWTQTESSGMVVLEMTKLTAYQPITDNLLHKHKNKGLKRFEEDEKKIVLYFDEFPNGEEICVDIESVNVAPVSNLQKAVVLIYSYYNTDQQKSSFYLPDSLKNKTVCTSCPECCQGVTTPGTPIYRKDNCKPNPCHNNGVCFDDLNNYICQCQQGFIGVNCEFIDNGQNPNVASIKDGRNAATMLSASVVTFITVIYTAIVLL